MTKDTEALLPCPFCGGDPELIDDRTGWFVRCNACKPFATVIYGENVRHIDDLDADTKVMDAVDWAELRQSAISAWNRRTLTPDTIGSHIGNGGGLDGGDVAPVACLPESIGRLHLGERRASNERLCNDGHTIPDGHPLYWPQQMGEYDDNDPYCLAHAIEQAESDAGWCATCLDREHRDSVAHPPHPAPVDPVAGGEALHPDTIRLNALLDECWDLRSFAVPTGGGDADVAWKVVGHWMAAPHERVIAEGWSHDPRVAIDAALAALKGPAA
ncbi:MAG: hypothetical protein CL858_29580 [Cupriavidus sp.]|uniref:Lar family restriction alleviation protein n=1 Tax=Sphingobium sp. TaxID=1912891 RepID=UPI000C639EAE|nr:Lar family restriction alleviation protein [Sphingobium sp.]MBS87126.1 hypothetical protein [Sphingobium sp.]MBU69531.1 hypothetical protein [Cupriavidus sp.]